LPNYWSLKENINLVLVDPSTAIQGQARALYFAHFNPVAGDVQVVTLDPKLKVNLLGGYEDYELRSIYPLLTLEKRDEQFLTAAYSFALDEVVDRVVVLDGSRVTPEDLELVKRRGELKKQLWTAIVREKRTSGVWDQQLLTLYFFLNAGTNWRPSRLQSGDEASLAAFHRQDFSRADNQHCSVVVVNSTAVSGLAGRIATVLEKDGYFVTRTGNFAEALSRTTIFYNEEAVACMELISRSIKVFPLRPEVVKGKEVPHQHRAGVVIVAGEDLTKTP